MYFWIDDGAVGGSKGALKRRWVEDKIPLQTAFYTGA